jgi:CRISPR-associated protein Csx14
MNQQVLIATLGSEPQVVTLVLDLLRAKGYPVAEVIVVHTMGEVVQQEEDRRRKREFVEHWLTRAERELVRLACKGLDNAAIARQLHKSEKTVANQFTHIYERLHEWRGFRKDIPVSRPVLVAEFAPYFALERR